MPYIKKEQKGLMNSYIADLVNVINKYDLPLKPSLSYITTKLVRMLTKDKESYDIMSDIVGTLTCTMFEYYRRQVGPYEDKKIKENGDI